MKKFKYIVLLFLLVSCGGDKETKTIEEQDDERQANSDAWPTCESQIQRCIKLYGQPIKIIVNSETDVIYYWLEVGANKVSFGINFVGKDDCYSTDVEYFEEVKI